MKSEIIRGGVAGWLLVVMGLVAMGTMGSPLPEDYYPIDSIQAKPQGEPYINTGFVPNPQTDRMEVKVSFSSIGTSQAIWCARSNTANNVIRNSWTTFLLANGLPRFDYNTSVSPSLTGAGTTLEKDVVYTFTVSNGSLRASNGVSVDFENVPNFTGTVNPLVFFCSYSTNALDRQDRSNYANTMRLHGAKIWRSGELVHDYVPYRKSSVYEPVLWDRVEDNVLSTVDCWIGPDRATNLAVRVNRQLIVGDHAVTPDLAVTETTTGRTLMKGEDYDVRWTGNGAPGTAQANVRVHYGSGTYGEMSVPVQVQRDVPAEYTPLAYIEGDGHTWLLTDYIPNPQTDTLKFDYELTKVETTAFTCARADSNSSSTWSVCIINSSYRFDYASNRDPSGRTGLIATGAPYSFTVANNVVTFSDGNQIEANKNVNFKTTVNPLQFYAFYVNGPNSGQRNTVSYYRTYRCQVWRSGALIHDWAPVRTPQGVVTLVDTVTGKIPTLRTDGNANAGFKAGPVVARSFATAAVPVQTWDGATPCTPALDVRDAASGTPLTAGTDYTVAYASNNAPGTAYATVAGLAAYAGATSVVPFIVARAIPSGYEPLEYIQGANQAYFVTDFTPNPSTDRIEMNLALTQTGINASPFCARGSGSTDRTYTVFLLQAGGLRVDYYNTTRFQVTKDLPLDVGRRYLLRYAGPIIDFGDHVHGGYFPKYGFTEAGSALHLFVDTTHAFYSTQRLFDCGVWRDGVPLRLWVPVKRTSDGVATLFDRMTGAVLTPSGGSFVAGPKKADYELFVRSQPWTAGGRFRPVVTATNTLTGAALVRGGDFTDTVVTNPAARYGYVTATGCAGSTYEGQSRSRDFELYPALPEGYERLAYIQGDGKTVLVTGVTPTPTKDRLLATFEPVDDGTHGLFCARGSNAFDRAWACCTIKDAVLRMRFDYGTSNWVFGTVLLTHARNCAALRNNQLALGSGDSQTIGGASVTEAGGPLALLGYYTMKEGQPAFSTYSELRLYTFRYWKNGVLTLDLVPVRTPEGVVTMFDYVSGEPLTPTGKAGGAFLAGPVWEVDPPPPPGLFFFVR